MLRILKPLFLILSLSLLTLSLSYAQNSVRDAELQIERLLRNAVSYYENLEIDPMEGSLDRIFNIERRFGPATPRMAEDIAQAYIYKGLLVSLKDSRDEVGIKRYFVRAIQTDPRAQMSPSIRTPTLNRIFEDARRESRPRNTYAGGGAYNNSRRPAAATGGYPTPTPTPPSSGGYAQGQPNGAYGNRPPQNPYGNQRPPQNPYGNQQAPQNPYGNQQAPQNPYGNQRPPQNPYGNQQAPQNPYGNNNRNPANTNASTNRDVSHTPPAQVVGSQTFDVRINIAPYLTRQVYWATLFYQTRATNGTQTLMMSREGSQTFVAQIPANFMTGNRIQYYIVLYDQAKNIVTSYRNSRSPVTLQIRGGQYADLKGAGNTRNRSSKDYKVSLSIQPGTGFGQVTETAALQVQKAQKVTEGFALTPLHTQLEFDYWTGSSFGIGIFTRIQILEPAFAGGLQAKWRFKHSDEISSSIRFGGGYGRVRHLVPVATKDKELLDTTLAGPIFYKLGIELSYHLSSRMAFKPTLDFIHLIALDTADTTQSPSRHFDVTLGLEIKF